VVLAATIAAGVAILLPSDLRVLSGKSLPATLGFGANILFWRQSGYFDSSAELNPLLHTWSLSVEEQFYIGLPILLFLVHRWGRRQLKIVLLFVALASFALCVWNQGIRPRTTFFLSPFRAWELMLGALLAVGLVPTIVSRSHREVVAGFSLLLLLGSIALTKPDMNFPGWRAAFPVLGTAGLLHAGASGRSVTQRLLRFRPLVWVGLISYSLYLWHWPILVYAKWWNGLDPIDNWRWLLLGLSLLLSVISYRFVERPFRRRVPGQGSWRVLQFAAAATLTLTGAGLLLFHGGGLPGRFQEYVVQLDQERYPQIPFLQRCFAQPVSAVLEHDDCHAGVPGVPPTVLVWGDSHALAWMPALDEVFRRAGVSALFVGSSDCPPLLGVLKPINYTCLPHNLEVVALIDARPSLRIVVMAASWLSNTDPQSERRIEDAAGTVKGAMVFPWALQRTAAILRNKGRTVWILGPVPGAPGDAPLRMALAARRGRVAPAGNAARAVRENTKNFYRAARSLPMDPMVIVTDPTAWFCDAVRCLYQAADGLPLYRDGGHLNTRGAAAVRPKLEIVFANIQRALGQIQEARP
jgi:peptidoglycan/LPS O-acetylase OafA/YrhL